MPFFQSSARWSIHRASRRRWFNIYRTSRVNCVEAHRDLRCFSPENYAIRLRQTPIRPTLSGCGHPSTRMGADVVQFLGNHTTQRRRRCQFNYAISTRGTVGTGMSGDRLHVDRVGVTVRRLMPVFGRDANGYCIDGGHQRIRCGNGE